MKGSRSKKAAAIKKPAANAFFSRRNIIAIAVTIAACVAVHFALDAAMTQYTLKRSEEPKKTGKEALPEIHLKDAYALYKRNNAVFIDARGANEYNEKHIKGAISIPAGSPPEKIAEYKDLLKGRVLVSYCHGIGCHLSTKTAMALYDAGYRKIKIFFGGWNEWTAAGYPVESSAEAGQAK